MSKPPVPPKPRPMAGKVRAMVKRQLIVNPSFQFRMLIPIGIFAVILGALVLAFIFLPFQRDASYDPNPHIRALLSPRVLKLYLYFWPSFLFAIVVSSLYTLIRSNRIAGPLYKLRIVLIQHAEGKVMRIRFREGDEFREFEDVVNRLAKRMETLSAGSVQQLTVIQKRLRFLKARLLTQPMGNQEICNELDLVLKDASLD